MPYCEKRVKVINVYDANVIEKILYYQKTLFWFQLWWCFYKHYALLGAYELVIAILFFKLLINYKKEKKIETINQYLAKQKVMEHKKCLSRVHQCLF